MLVSNLQQFLHLLLPPLRAVGISAKADESVTKSLEAMAGFFTPFKDLSLEQLSELLRVAQEYRETGQIPQWVLGKKPAASKPRLTTPKAPKPPKMTQEQALVKLRDLQSRSQELDPERITNEVQTLMQLSGNDLKAVQKEFLEAGAVIGKNKPQQVDAIKRRIFAHRESKLRSEEILHG